MVGTQQLELFSSSGYSDTGGWELGGLWSVIVHLAWKQESSNCWQKGARIQLWKIEIALKPFCKYWSSGTRGTSGKSIGV